MQIRNTLLAILMIVPLYKMSSQSLNSNPIAIESEKETATSCPFFSKDINGTPVMAFGKAINENESVICYSMFDLKTNTFQKPIEIPTSKGADPMGENAPKIIFKPNKEIIAVWGISNHS